jgi:MinD-like ATPase involved in chromosome partitioning or flagellar assembly
MCSLSRQACAAETDPVTALTVGVTTARDPACKRGIATNVAASLARHAAAADRVCVVDADPIALDVTTRLGVSGPVLEDYARPKMPTAGQLARLHSPNLAVVPCDGAAVGRLRVAVEHALPVLRDAFDVVVCDLPGGPSGPDSVVGNRLELLDWLVLTVTPEPGAVQAAAHFLELFTTAQQRGDVRGVQLAVVCTGDESCSELEADRVASMLGTSVASRIPQLWGRAEPNLGFGPALAIPELDHAVYDLFASFRHASFAPHALATV